MHTGNSSATKSYWSGTHRVVPPQDTVERLRPVLSSMGITRVANVTGLDNIGIPVVMVVRPNARSVCVSQGKGLDLWAARASGLMESVESYHAENITLPLKYASYSDLSRVHLVADIAQLPRENPSLFHENRPLLWVEGFNLLGDEAMWVPFELVHTTYTVDKTLSPGNFAASSNGLASGNHLLEAISHGICEVVERDATTLRSLLPPEKQDLYRIDLGTVDDPNCVEVIDKYKRADVAVAVWDSTTDIGIACFDCSIVDRESKGHRDLYSAGGSGCHPSREVALLRALTEAAQSRAAYISGSRDDLFRGTYDRAISPEAIQNKRERIERCSPTRSFRNVPTFAGETIDSDVAWELNRLRSVGIEQVIVVNLSKSEYGIAVVRVIIPGLEARGTVPNCQFGKRARTRMETEI